MGSWGEWNGGWEGTFVLDHASLVKLTGVVTWLTASATAVTPDSASFCNFFFAEPFLAVVGSDWHVLLSGVTR